MLSVVITGCGSSSDGGSTSTKADATSATKDKLAQVLARGTLVGYHEADYPPQSMDVKGAARPAGTKCAARN